MTGFQCLPPRPQLPIPLVPFHHWTLPDGDLFVQFYRTPEGYLLRFPGNADFDISTVTLEVTCFPAPDVPMSSCEHLYLNQVQPLILARQGKIVLHGSAVAAAGRALAFVGEAGRGKSTLATAFAVNGFPFLSDDGLVFEPDGSGYRVLPSHPSVRLWDDSHEALLPPDAPVAPAVHYTSKARFIAGRDLGYCEQPATLGAVYFLGPGAVEDTAIYRLDPGDAVAALLQHSFILDIEDHNLLSAQFDRLAKFANSVSCFRLDYPRSYDDLPRVIADIRAHAAS